MVITLPTTMVKRYRYYNNYNYNLYYNSYTFQFIRFIKISLLLYSYLFIFFQYITSARPIKIAKLYDNDSLAFLYILSSRSHSLLFLLLLIMFNIYKLNNRLFMIIIFIIVYSTPQANFFNYVLNFFRIITTNTSLQNGLLNIHPILIYYIYSQLLYIWLLKYIYINNKQTYVRATSYVYLLTIISLFGMYLGAMWASQELNWGGYWSWDPVEIISLFVGLLLINFLHNKFSHAAQPNLFFFISTIWVIYIIIRLGVITTIHSFIRNNIVNIYIFVSILFMILYFSFFFNFNSHNVYSFFKLSKRHNNYKIQIFILLFYIYSYLLNLLCSFYLLDIFPKISEFCVIYFLTIIIYWTLTHSNINVNVYMFVTIFGILISILTGFKFLILLCLVLYTIKYFKTHITLHLTLFLIYLIFFFFMCNITCYTHMTSRHAHRYILSISTSSTHAGATDLYEIFFFLKKNLILMKLKNIGQHISGFCILTNGALSSYLFTKNFSLRFLYNLEVLQFTNIIITMIILVFFKIYFNIQPKNLHY